MEQIVIVAFPHLRRVKRWRTWFPRLGEHSEVRRGGKGQQLAEHCAVEDVGRVGKVTERDRRLVTRGRGKFVHPGSRPFAVTKDADWLGEADVRWYGTCFLTAIIES